VDLPFPCSNEEYEARMAVTCERAVREGFVGVAFGDLFLEEIRAYRVAKLAGTGLEPVFPVWGIPTDVLAREMMAGGLRARLTCVDPRKVPVEFAGREWDAALLAELPDGVDPCGENGEFHTFCWAGPMFSREIAVVAGERVERDGFVYAELVDGA
jgi:diphthamide synthase (EF-2-diphthine--ammonia ligase)